MSLELPYGIKRLDASSDADELFGYYLSLEEACTAVAPGLRKGGRRVGIKQPDGKIQIYWWENDNDLSDDGLVPFATGGGQGGNYFKEIIKDGDFSVTKIEGGVDDGKYEIKIKGEDTLEWVIGNNTSVFELDEHNEWKTIADALGEGIERRIDATTYGPDGQVHYFKGKEGQQATYPSVPQDHIVRSFVTLTESGISFNDDDYIAKGSERWWGLIFFPAVTNFQLSVDGAARNHWVTNQNEDLIINSISERHPSYAPACWNGMIVRYWNRDSTAIHTLRHGQTIGGKKILFPTGQDYEVKPGEIVTLSRIDVLNAYVFICSNLSSCSPGGALTKIANWTPGLVASKDEVVYYEEINEDYGVIRKGVWRSKIDGNNSTPFSVKEIDTDKWKDLWWDKRYLGYIAGSYDLRTDNDIPPGTHLIYLEEPLQDPSTEVKKLIGLLITTPTTIPAGTNLLLFTPPNLITRFIYEFVEEEDFEDFVESFDLYHEDGYCAALINYVDDTEGEPLILFSSIENGFMFSYALFGLKTCPYKKSAFIESDWELISTKIEGFGDVFRSQGEDIYTDNYLLWHNSAGNYISLNPNDIELRKLIDREDRFANCRLEADNLIFSLHNGNSRIRNRIEPYYPSGLTRGDFKHSLPPKSGTVAHIEDVFVDNYTLDARETVATWISGKKIMKVTFYGTTFPDGIVGVDVTSFGVSEGELIQIEGIYSSVDGQRSVPCNFMRHIDFVNNESEIAQCYLDRSIKRIVGSWNNIADRTVTPIQFNYKITLKYILP